MGVVGGHGNNGSRNSHEYITWLINYYIAPHSHTNRAPAQWFNYTFQKRGLLGFLSPPSLCDSALFRKDFNFPQLKKVEKCGSFFLLKRVRSAPERRREQRNRTTPFSFPLNFPEPSGRSLGIKIGCKDANV